MKKLSANLKALMAEINISESELARRTGIGQPVVHRIVSGGTDNPKVGTLSPIANFFGLSISQLIGDEPMPPGRLQGSYNPEGIHGWHAVPLLELGEVLEWLEKFSLDRTTPIPAVSTDLLLSPSAFAIRINDPGAEPRFSEGTLLIIEPAYQPQNRDFALVGIQGQKIPSLRQVLIDASIVYLKPLNPEFKTLPFDDRYKFLGVVVQARMDFVNR